jgi:hypothetical protein
MWVAKTAATSGYPIQQDIQPAVTQSILYYDAMTSSRVADVHNISGFQTREHLIILVTAYLASGVKRHCLDLNDCLWVVPPQCRNAFPKERGGRVGSVVCVRLQPAMINKRNTKSHHPQLVDVVELAFAPRFCLTRDRWACGVASEEVCFAWIYL